MNTIYFDLETGGLEMHHPIIQLAAVAIDDVSSREIDSINLLFDFDVMKADPAALQLNHFDEDRWRMEALDPLVAVEAFRQFCQKHRCVSLISAKSGRPYQVARLAGHNAASFDAPRLFNLYKENGVFLPADFRVRDTLQRALWYFHERPAVAVPNDYKLATLCQYFGIAVPAGETHDALVDVRLTAQLARAIQEAGGGQ